MALPFECSGSLVVAGKKKVNLGLLRKAYVNLLVAAFGFLTLGSPKRACVVQAMRLPHTALQAALVRDLEADVARFLGSDEAFTVSLTGGRENISGYLHGFVSKYDLQQRPEELLSGFTQVDPERVSVPKSGACIQLETAMDESIVQAMGMKDAFLLPDELIPDPLPRSCSKISSEAWLVLCRKMIEAGMVRLIHPDRAARFRGRTVRAKLFAVAKKDGKQRLICDRRANNAMEMSVVKLLELQMGEGHVLVLASLMRVACPTAASSLT
jgi:hypothetical protein